MKARSVSFRQAGVAAMMLALVAASPAAAQKTDVVILANGDTLTCEIKSLNKGRLTADTDNMSTVSIEWDKVASVTSSRVFQVETSAGRRLFGALGSKTPGHVEVVNTSITESFDLIDIVLILPIGDGFWQRLEGSLDFGLSYTQSSGVAQMSFNTNTVFRRPSFEMKLTASSYFTRQPDADDSERETVQLAYTRPFGERWAALGTGGVERNRDLGYDLRSTASAGLSRFLIQSNRARVSVGGGLSTSTELPVGGVSVQSLDALLSFQQRFFTYDYPKTEVAMTLTGYPGLSQWGRIRLQFDGTLKREIVHDFTIGVTAYDTYDNRPPTAAARKNDVGFSLNAGWTF